MLKAIRLLWSLLGRHERFRAALVLLLMLAVAVGEVVGVASIMPFIAVLAKPDLVAENRILRWVYATGGFSSIQSFHFVLGLFFLLTLLASLTLKAIGTWAQLRFVYNRSLDWSTRLVSAYLRQPYAWFLSRNTNDLASTILSEVENVTTGAMLPLLSAMAHAAVVVFLLATLFFVEPILALSSSLLMGGGFGLTSLLTRQRLQRFGEERWKADKARFTAIAEAFGGIKDVKLLHLERSMLDRFTEAMSVRVRRVASVLLLIQLPPLVLQSLLFGGMLLAILYLMRTTGSFSESLPLLGLFALAGYRLMPAIQRVFEETSKVRNVLPIVEGLVLSISSLEKSAESASSTDVPLTLHSELELQGISYSYPGVDKPALNNVSLKLVAGSSLGVVGSTGSGKTTLIDLILGLLSPSTGRILVDGLELSSDRHRAWQLSIGYVPQQIFLTDDSVRANIAFGVRSEDVLEDRVIEAAKLAQIHDFITTSMADGYNTAVGERGIRLSGGQRQRIGIARALYNGPSLIVLDEATSALDNITESEFVSALRALDQRVTTIVVAHRLSTIKHCSQILLLGEGRVVDIGTYDELIDRSPYFARLARAANDADG